MKLKCPACSKLLQIPDSAAGKVVKCPCGKSLRAPAAQPAGAAPAKRAPPTRGAAPAKTAARRPVAASGGSMAVDDGLFDELTDADHTPVYVAPKVTAASAGNPYANSSALEKYVNADELKAFAAEGAGSADYVIAGLGSRFVALLIDGLFVAALTAIEGVIIYFVFGALDIQINDQLFAKKPFIALAALLLAFPHMVNWVLISKSGQSLGKKLAGIVMLDERSGQPVGFGQGVGSRQIGWGLICGIPVIGLILSLADIGFVFSERARTLHDRLAGTVVAVKTA